MVAAHYNNNDDNNNNNNNDDNNNSNNSNNNGYKTDNKSKYKGNKLRCKPVCVIFFELTPIVTKGML